MQNFRKILQLSRAEWPLLALGFFFLVVSSGALLAYPHTIKVIIDEAISHKDQARLNGAAWLAVALFALQALTGALRYYYFTLAGERTVKRLRARLFHGILSQDMAFFDRQKTGELVGRLGSDTGVLQNALSVNISMLVRGGAQALGGLVMLFMTSAQLTFFILLVIPPLAFLAARFGKSIKAMSRRSQDALATSSGVAEEGLSAVRTVKAFAQEGFESQRYERRLEASFALARDKIAAMARFTGCASAMGLAALVLVVWYGGSLVIQGEMTVGTLTSFLLYVMTVGFSAAMLGSLWSDFMAAIGASTRIFQLLEEKPQLVDGASPVELRAGKVEFRGVHFSYPARPDFPVLNGVSFTLQPQQTVAVVGASGAGKSTLVQLLLRFYDPTSGEVILDGVPLKQWRLAQLRQGVGVVSQEPVLVSESLRDNIRYGRPGASDSEVEQAARLAYAHDFIMAFPEGYQTLVGERGVQLSGGQKQRVAIARAILMNPRLLVLDEATSALDAESEHLVQQALSGLMGARTTLIIAHRLSTVKRADLILVMQDGAIVQVGTHAELMQQTDHAYHRLVQKQFESTKETP